MLNTIKSIYSCIYNNIDFIGMVIAILGSFGAIYQWKKSNDYKRAEIVHQLITDVRDDHDIATIMDILDWNSGIEYDGKFHMLKCHDESEDDERKLFTQIDKTLSHFSYICYLYERKCLRDKDMYHFEYALRRIADNESISNYLFTLFHWSSSRDASCSFRYLIEYALQKEYLDEDNFRNPNSDKYKLKLYLPESYLNKYK